jgi:hypothetical protein
VPRAVLLAARRGERSQLHLQALWTSAAGTYLHHMLPVFSACCTASGRWATS